MAHKLFKGRLSNVQQVSQLLMNFSLRPVKRIHYSFDPYSEKVRSIRELITMLNSKKVLRTSSLRSKIDIKSDGSKPQMDVEFADGHKVIFLTENLQVVEILSRLDRYCREKDTSEPEADIALTKMSGKMKRKK